MKQDLNNVMKKAEDQIKEIISIDTDLLTIHQNFPNWSNEDKRNAIDDYEGLLEERDGMIDLIKDVQNYLLNVVSELDNVKMNRVDKFSHYLKIKSMKKAIANLVDIDNDDVVVVEQTSGVEKAEKVDKESLKDIIVEIKKEKQKVN